MNFFSLANSSLYTLDVPAMVAGVEAPVKLWQKVSEQTCARRGGLVSWQLNYTPAAGQHPVSDDDEMLYTVSATGTCVCLPAKMKQQPALKTRATARQREARVASRRETAWRLVSISFLRAGVCYFCSWTDRRGLMSDSRHILLVEDSKFYGMVIKDRITSTLGWDVTWAQSLAEAREALASGDPFFLAVLDLILPDSADDGIVDLALEHEVLPIVLTSSYSDDLRRRIWRRRVADYVIKEGPQAVDYVVSLIRRIGTNHEVGVLVVDGIEDSCAALADLLRVNRYRVKEAGSGQEAIAAMDDDPTFQLLIVDDYIQGMDCFELVKRVRKKFARDRMAIIGISDIGSGHTSARFIKSGANDFLYKPFSTEELYCRVAENVTALQQYCLLEDMANRDYLTGLYNRRYLFAVGEKLLANARRKNLQMGVAILDLDFFKRVNDTYGHEAGDEVLKEVSAVLNSRFRESDVVARIGGEEFCVLTANMDPSHTRGIFETLRRSVEELRIKSGEHSIQPTVSIGVNLNAREASLESAMARADECLYRAKEEGRNRVVYV